MSDDKNDLSLDIKVNDRECLTGNTEMTCHDTRI